MACVQLQQRSTGAVELLNTCSHRIEVSWCVEGYDCKNGNWGYSNSTALSPGKSYPATGSKGRRVYYAACDTAHASIIEAGNGRFSCR
jgi:hypothetical protein